VREVDGDEFAALMREEGYWAAAVNELRRFYDVKKYVVGDWRNTVVQKYGKGCPVDAFIYRDGTVHPAEDNEPRFKTFGLRLGAYEKRPQDDGLTFVDGHVEYERYMPCNCVHVVGDTATLYRWREGEPENMITKLKAKEFGCLADVEVRPKRINLVIGPADGGRDDFLDLVWRAAGDDLPEGVEVTWDPSKLAEVDVAFRRRRVDYEPFPKYSVREFREVFGGESVDAEDYLAIHDDEEGLCEQFGRVMQIHFASCTKLSTLVVRDVIHDPDITDLAAGVLCDVDGESYFVKRPALLGELEHVERTLMIYMRDLQERVKELEEKVGT